MCIVQCTCSRSHEKGWSEKTFYMYIFGKSRTSTNSLTFLPNFSFLQKYLRIFHNFFAQCLWFSWFSQEFILYLTAKLANKFIYVLLWNFYICIYSLLALLRLGGNEYFCWNFYSKALKKIVKKRKSLKFSPSRELQCSQFFAENMDCRGSGLLAVVWLIWILPHRRPWLAKHRRNNLGGGMCQIIRRRD
jgi:hypothetical protein